MAAIAIPRLGSFNQAAQVRAAEAEHRIIVGAIQMWQAGNSDPSVFPASFTATNTQNATVASFLDGGTAGLQFPTNHTINGTNLTTTRPGGGASWVYPTH